VAMEDGKEICNQKFMRSMSAGPRHGNPYAINDTPMGCVTPTLSHHMFPSIAYQRSHKPPTRRLRILPISIQVLKQCVLGIWVDMDTLNPLAILGAHYFRTWINLLARSAKKRREIRNLIMSMTMTKCRTVPTEPSSEFRRPKMKSFRTWETRRATFPRQLSRAHTRASPYRNCQQMWMTAQLEI